MPRKAPPPSTLPEIRPENELADSPTMHPDHELPGRKAVPALTGNSAGKALYKAVLSGTILTVLLWIVLVFSSTTINQVSIILFLIGPLWIIAVMILYRFFRKS